ncbi:protein of unknown function [Hyphomicrobium sp. MC1]|nr:protein of unknown function [Hyphomicrobium sp. MC1]
MPVPRSSFRHELLRGSAVRFCPPLPRQERGKRQARVLGRIGLVRHGDPKRSDLFRLVRHRLLCGDGLDEASYKRTLGGGAASARAWDHVTIPDFISQPNMRSRADRRVLPRKWSLLALR